MENLTSYEINEEGPLGKKIKEIIIRKEDAIVYLDIDEIIQWSTNGKDVFHKDFGEIQNKISYWESLSNKVLDRKESYDLKCLLAEAYARILDNEDIVTARDIIEQCKIRIEKLGCEMLKQAYAFSSLAVTILCIISVFFIRDNRSSIIERFSYNIYEIVLTMMFGGIGAFIFAILRLKTYVPEIVVSKRIHRLDGILRVFYGVIAGLMVAIAIKSNIIFGFLNSIEKSIYVSVFLGTIAGASEMFIPNLIKQIDGKAFETDK